MAYRPADRKPGSGLPRPGVRGPRPGAHPRRPYALILGLCLSAALAAQESPWLRRATQLASYDGQKVRAEGTYGWTAANTALVPVGGGALNPAPGGQGQLRLEDGTLLLLGARDLKERRQWERKGVIVVGTLHVKNQQQPSLEVESVEADLMHPR